MMQLGPASGEWADFHYQFDFQSESQAGDHILEHEGAQVVLDDRALLSPRGGKLAFKTD
jgi:Fe-S cluster assembly iron-binding protein IscA